MIDEPADLTRVLEAKLRDRREFARLYGSDEERAPADRPPGHAERRPGMLERIHRAVKTTEEGEPAAPPPSPPSPRTEAQVDPGAAGLPLPGS